MYCYEKNLFTLKVFINPPIRIFAKFVCHVRRTKPRDILEIIGDAKLQESRHSRKLVTVWHRSLPLQSIVLEITRNISSILSPAACRRTRIFKFPGQAQIANEYKSVASVKSHRQNSSARLMGCADIFTNDPIIC